MVPSEVKYRHLAILGDAYNHHRITNIINMVTLLIQKGADFRARNAAGETPFSLLQANHLLRYLVAQLLREGK